MTGRPASGELLPVSLVDALADLQPLLRRARRNGWRILVIGACTADDRSAATQLSDRMMRLADAMEADE
jgi:3-deoxy-D-arabino-heptulosonate 7-phosphate (DAHP) synthase